MNGYERNKGPLPSGGAGYGLGLGIPQVSWDSRVAKFNPKVGSRRKTKIRNLVVLVIILVVPILLSYYICMWY